MFAKWVFAVVGMLSVNLKKSKWFLFPRIEYLEFLMTYFIPMEQPYHLNTFLDPAGQLPGRHPV